MRHLALTFVALLACTGKAASQTSFNDVASFCKVASEVSTPSLMARTQNLPKSRAEALMQGMTDPQAIKMVREVIAFAYSRPAGTPVEVLRSELNSECVARRIFVQ
jgi:hypothetical protein